MMKTFTAMSAAGTFSDLGNSVQVSLIKFACTTCISLLMLATTAQAATLTFDLNNSFASNENAAISLTPNGGTLGPTGYTFAAGQGLSINLGAAPTSYSIDMKFDFSPLRAGFSKVLDFSNLTSDIGLYILNGAVDLFPTAVGSGSGFTDGVIHDVTITRDVSGTVSISLDGVASTTTFVDTSSVFNGSLLTFFADDASTGHSEQSPGFVDSITIATNLTTTTAAPEPPTWAMMLIGFAGLGYLGFCQSRQRMVAAG